MHAVFLTKIMILSRNRSVTDLCQQNNQKYCDQLELQAISSAAADFQKVKINNVEG